MASEKALGVVDHVCEAFDNEGLFCMDSSAIPSSLGVNPSLTISAVCERAAESLVLRAADYGLPAPAAGHQFNPPSEIGVPGAPAASPNSAHATTSGATTVIEHPGQAQEKAPAETKKARREEEVREALIALGCLRDAGGHRHL